MKSTTLTAWQPYCTHMGYLLTSDLMMGIKLLKSRKFWAVHGCASTLSTRASYATASVQGHVDLYYMSRVTSCIQGACMWVVNDQEEQSSRHKRRESNDACEEFSDIVKLLQPFPSTKMTWHSDFTFAAILLCSAFLFLFASDTATCWLLSGGPCTPLTWASVVLLALCLCFVGTVMHWLCSTDSGMK